MGHKEFFARNGQAKINGREHKHPICTVEELYQFFKARLLGELLEEIDKQAENASEFDGERRTG